MKKIVNVTANEEIERPLNAEELAQQEIDKAKYTAIADAQKAEAEAKAAQKAALLERLGITEDEARLLLG